MKHQLLAALCLLSACQTSVDRDLPQAPTTSHKNARLVIAVVYDQFPAWAYSSYRSALSPQGALLRTSRDGGDHVVEYDHADTITAAGHAAIFSGAVPALSGVASNQVWSDERGSISVVDDGVHGVFGLPGSYTSPSVMRVDSVADRMREHHGDRARIVGLSLKDRGSVLTTGRAPDLAVWYEKRLGAFTSSSYYGKALPQWLRSWLQTHPTTDYYKPWSVDEPESLERMLGADEAPGEADYQGYGTAFPHDPATSLEPNNTFRLAPESTEYLLELARVCIAELELGHDEIPDLLVLSFSSLDYVGHVFGPDSWEYLDHLIRIDTALGTLIEELEAETELAVLITSDHGGASLPERSKKDKPKAGRLYPDELPSDLDLAIGEVLGQGSWVSAYLPPFVYLRPEARRADTRQRAIAATLEALRALPEVHAAFDVREAANWGEHSDPIKGLVGRSIPSPELGDVFIVLARDCIVDEGFEKGKGTGHGSPWDYDRQVPVVFDGPGVSASASTAPLEQARVAATLAALLGVSAPASVGDLAPLPGL